MERTSIAGKVDRTGEKCESPTLKVRCKCLSELPSRDSASETRKLVGDPPAQIKEFQKKEAGDEYEKSSNNLCMPSDKQKDGILEAHIGRMIEEIAKLQEMVAILKANNTRIRREHGGGKGKKTKPKAANRRMAKENAKHKEKKTVSEAEYRRMTDEPIKEILGVGEISASELEKAVVERVEDFVEQLDANVKSQVDYSDFKILEKDLRKDLKKVGRFSVPLYLDPISERINDTFGDITSDSLQSDCSAMPSYVLFCAAIREMDDMKLDQVDEAKMLLWRDAINSALNVQFKVDFAIKHLKKIARAYFGLKAMEGKSSEELKNIDGIVRKTEVPEDCLREAKYFWGKPLSTGLLR